MKRLRDTYFPGTEELGTDEMRLTALGTGTPQLRPSQAAACWFLELGNGDKFFFDMGAGSMMNFAALGQSFVKANKLFLSHLHIDHMSDFIPWYIGGWVERLGDGGVEVWGPTGTEPKLGTKFCINGLIDACRWDITSRRGTFPEEGLAIEINEFEYAALNEVVYDRNGVVVRSWPAVHLLDGADSLEYITSHFDAGSHLDIGVLRDLIERSLEIKKAIIEKDEFDRDYRNILNYGHTFGHAIESLTEYEVCHGQAVTVGMDVANFVSLRLGILSAEHFAQMRIPIMKNYPEFRLKEEHIDQLLIALTKDKKNVDENLSMILTNGPGKMQKTKLSFDNDLKQHIIDYIGSV